MLLRLVVQIVAFCQGAVGAEQEEKVRTLGMWDVKWDVVVWGLWKEVSEAVERSHGLGSAFWKDVAEFGQCIGSRPKDVEERLVAREWVKLKTMGEELVE